MCLSVRQASIVGVAVCLVGWNVSLGLAQQLRVAESVQAQLPGEARKLVEQFESQSAEIQNAADRNIHKLRRQLIRALKPMQDEYTREAKLDEAVAVRDCIRMLGESAVRAQPDPGSLANYGNRVGSVCYFRVTGSAKGPLWGTDVYTSDSLLATAAVHAGVLKNQQTGIVKVTLLPGQASYQGAMRNGVVSQPWQSFPASFTVTPVMEETIAFADEETVVPASSDEKMRNTPPREVAELAASLRKIEQRVSQLEKHTGAQAAPRLKPRADK
jgi:hypothetical protein